MKKIILVSLFFFAGIISVSADTGASIFSWSSTSGFSNCGNTSSHSLTHQGLPNSTANVSAPSGVSNCTTHLYYTPSDSVQPTVGRRNRGQIFNCPPQQRVVGIQRYNAGVPTGGNPWDEYTITCRSWDDTPPSVGYALSGGTTTSDTWTNLNVRSTATCTDTGTNGSPTVGSGCTGTQYRRQSTNFTCNSGGTWVNGSTYNHAPPINTNLVEYICFRSRDIAGNIYDYSTVATIKIDKITPALADIQPISPAPGNLLATNSQNIRAIVGQNGGAPITQVRGYVENYTTADSFSGTPLVSNSGNFQHTVNFSNVDLSRNAQGNRQYRLKITQIRDEAGNIRTLGNDSTNALGINNYTYNVYSNTTNIAASLVSEQLSNITNIADGTAKNLVLRLRDNYNNAIVPATGIGRTIDFEIQKDNELRLNQYNDTGTASALFVGNITTQVPTGSSIFNQDLRSSTNGDYPFSFYMFSPTSNRSPLVPGYASISSIRYDINRATGISSGDNPQNVGIAGTNIILSARPLFEVTLQGELATAGFLEGATQSLGIVKTKNRVIATSNEILGMEFGDVVAGANSANARFNATINANPVPEGNVIPWSLRPGYSAPLTVGTTNNNFYMLQGGAVQNQTFSYLASIVTYTINGKQIVYPQGIIGKDSYHGTLEGDNSYQGGVKAFGNVSSQNNQSVTVDQFTTDVRILGSLTKASFRNDIEKKVFSVIKGITPKTGGSAITLNLLPADLNRSNWNVGKFWTTGPARNDSLGTSLYGNQVVYFGTGSFAGSVVLQGATNIEGDKTIVVEDRDVYITGDIRNSDGDGILGIIVLNGNIYVDPSVTDIHASMYTNRSIMSSSDGINGLDGNTTAYTLRNQLYVYGSIFSENTLGASRKSPVECPYYVKILCTQIVAQMYDLNFMRRYYMYDTSSPADGVVDTPSGFQSYAGTTTRGSRSNMIMYPFVIEYNSLIQQTPPPFFE